MYKRAMGYKEVCSFSIFCALTLSLVSILVFISVQHEFM